MISWFANLKRLSASKCRITTPLHDSLGSQRHLGPGLIEFPGLDLLDEILEQIRFLRSGVAVAVLGNGPATNVRFDPEIASLNEMRRADALEGDFAPGKGQDEIRHVQITSSSADMRPLRKPRDKRAVELTRDAALEEELTGKLRDGRCRTERTFLL